MTVVNEGNGARQAIRKSEEIDIRTKERNQGERAAGDGGNERDRPSRSGYCALYIEAMARGESGGDI